MIDSFSMCWFIDGIRNNHADQMLRTTAEAYGEGLDSVKLV